MKRTSVRPTFRLSASMYVCPFVCMSHRLTAAAACGVFAAEHRSGRRYRSTAAGATARRSAANAGSVVLTAEGRTTKLDEKELVLAASPALQAMLDEGTAPDITT